MSVRITRRRRRRRVDRLDDVAAALLDVVVGTDGDRLDLLLLADHVFQRRAKFDGEPPVGDKNQAYHLKIGTPAGAACAPPHERAPS